MRWSTWTASPADIEDDVRERFGGSSELGRRGILLPAALRGVAGALLLLLLAGLGRLGAWFGFHVPHHCNVGAGERGEMRVFVCVGSLARSIRYFACCVVKTRYEGR